MKSMTKKITATALFGVLAVSAFAGCGGANSSSNGSSDAGSMPQSLTHQKQSLL